MLRTWILVALVAVTVMGQCPLLPQPLPPYAEISQQSGYEAFSVALGALEDHVKEAVAKNDKLGISLVVTLENTTLLNRGYGFARLDDSGAAVVPDPNETLWRLGSVTKAFTAMLVLSMVDSGALPSLDIPLTDLLPGFQPVNTGEAPFGVDVRDVTLRNIASQTSGIAHSVPAPCLSDESRCNLTTAQILPAINTLRLVVPPDTQPSYSNLGYSLLGRAVAQKDALGRGFERLSGDILFRPLGMRSATYDLSQDVLSRLAVGAYPHLKPTNLGWAAPNGQLVASADDMAAFLLYLGRAGGTGPLSAGAKRRWFLPHFVLPDGVSAYGMPWEMMFVDGGGWILTKSGNIDNFGSIVMFHPQSQLGLFLAVNTPGEMATEMGSSAFAKLLPPLVSILVGGERVDDPSLEEVTMWKGTFRSYVPVLLLNMTITVDVESSTGHLELVFSFGSTNLPAFAVVQREQLAILHLSPSLPISCLLVTELAWDGSSMSLDPSGQQLSLPGLLPGVSFERQ